MMRPVKKLNVSERDITSLKAAEKRSAVAANQPEDYKGRVVMKPWGYEFLVFSNEYVAIWFLRVNKDHATSMHCHPLKKTSLILLSGRALCNTFMHRNFLSAGDALTVESSVFHSTKALSLEGVNLLEVETPPKKVDLVRLMDGYGRENLGYESTSEMICDELDRFNYFELDAVSQDKRIFTLQGVFTVMLESFNSPSQFAEKFRLEDGALYCLCKGQLRSDFSPVFHVGDVERGIYLRQKGQLSIDSDVQLLKISVFN